MSKAHCYLPEHAGLPYNSTHVIFWCAASAIVMAKEFGVGLKIIWRLEEGCGDSCGNPGFNSTWPDLFSEPKLRLADNFPGTIAGSPEMEALLEMRAGYCPMSVLDTFIRGSSAWDACHCTCWQIGDPYKELLSCNFVHVRVAYSWTGRRLTSKRHGSKQQNHQGAWLKMQGAITRPWRSTNISEQRTETI